MQIFKSNWFLGTLVALSLGSTYATVALTNDFGHMLGGKGVFKELNLSSEQKEKLKKLREETKSNRKEDRAQMKKEAESFRKKMATDASEDDLRKDFAGLQGKRAELAKDRFEHMLKVRAILTPEQRQKFADVMEKKMSQKKGKHGKRHQSEDSEE